MITAEYDMGGLTKMVSALDGALFGQGHDAGDIHRVLRTEAGQLAWDISLKMGPPDKASGDAKIERDAKAYLTTSPGHSNLDKDQQYSSTSDFTWLSAGPAWLDGINDEDNQPGASADDAMTFLRGGQKAGSRGKAYIELGMRGKQHVRRINRTRVSKSSFRQVVRSLSDRVGQLRASFAFTAAKLIPSKRVPSWIARHFESRAGGKAVFNDAGMANPTAPFIEFGSTARGVESNPRIAIAIDESVENRKHVIDAKIKKVLAGYAYDWNTGAVFLRREAQEE